MLSEELNTPLPGLGIPTDFSISFDGVSLGATSFSRHETVWHSVAGKGELDNLWHVVLGNNMTQTLLTSHWQINIKKHIAIIEIEEL